jgi:hypothetical protein
MDFYVCHVNVFTESLSSVTATAIMPARSSMVRAGPGFARTRTLFPSGFTQAMWLKFEDALADPKRRAPRRMAREK